jgi:YHS domain-containing protein
MKAKQAKQKVTISKRQKEKRRNTLLNFLGMLGLAIPLTWAVVGIYNYEKEEAKIKEVNEASLPGIVELIEPNKVCMYSDAFMNGNAQIVVPNIDGVYYACSHQCIAALQSNEGERYAIDPVSKNRINKAKAFICLYPDKSGKVCYFESKENHQTFIRTHTQ